MKFFDCDKKVSEADLAIIEKQVKLTFPDALRKLFLENNGGDPEHYVYKNGGLEVSTVISEILPIVSDSERGTAVDSYRRLIHEKKICPQNMFPFAVDGGGDYFLVDCSTNNSVVHFLQTHYFPDVQVTNLGVGLNEFWLQLQGE